MKSLESTIKKYCDLANMHLNVARSYGAWKVGNITTNNISDETEDICSELEKQSFESAMDCLNIAEAISVQENDIIYVAKAKVLSSQGNENAAIEYLSKAIEINPQKEKYYEDRARKYKGIKNYTAAIEDYENYIALNSFNRSVYLEKGSCHCHLKQWYDCFKCWGCAAMFDDCDYNCYESILSNIEYEFMDIFNLNYPQNYPQKATEMIDSLDVLIEEKPMFDLYYLMRGYVYEQIEQYEEAMNEYWQAMECNDNPMFCRQCINDLEQKMD